MSWKRLLHHSQVTGIEIPGDPSVPETKWYNLHWFRLFGWKKVAVLEVDEDAAMHFGEHVFLKAPLRFGYRNVWGQAQINDAPLANFRFRARVGREPSTFFVIDSEGNEVALKVVSVTTKDDPAYKHVPLM